ncbi:MAG: hypothetical protein ACKVU4_11735 [Phycisphaerales bacterium]
MVPAPAISESRCDCPPCRGDPDPDHDRDHSALNALARGEANLALQPAAVAHWAHRPDLHPVIDAAVWLEERRRRIQAEDVIHRAIDQLSATLRAKTDLTTLSQRIEVRRAAVAMADLAITILYGPQRSRSRTPAPAVSAPSCGTGVALTRRGEPVSSTPAPTPSRGTGVPATRRGEPVPTPSTCSAHSSPGAVAPAAPAPFHSSVGPRSSAATGPALVPADQPSSADLTLSKGSLLRDPEFARLPAEPARRGEAGRGGSPQRSLRTAAGDAARLLAHAGTADTS